MIFKLVTCGICAAALIIDEKTGISIGTLLAILGGIWWFGRKFQFFVDKVSGFDRFIEEFREWRGLVSDEQALAREEREQILRHQEQAKMRHEMIMKEMENIKEARELYAELIRRLEEMKDSVGKHSGHTDIIKKLVQVPPV